MKTPYYSGSLTATQHTDIHEGDEFRERLLERRLASRDDVRDIHVVTVVPFGERKGAKPIGSGLKMAAKASKTHMSWAMHWAIQVGDQYFELSRGYPDPLRTGLRRSSWDQEKQGEIIQRYRQGVTAMTDDEIEAVGERYFSRLERIDINTYDVWCNNCHIAVDRMLRDIGGLYYYRLRLQSLHDMVKQAFYNSILSITRIYGRFRGWNEEVINKYTEILHKTLRVMTSRSKYPKRHWIRSDLEAADGALKKMGTVKDHWFLTIMETSLSLRKGSEELYVRRGADGKPELNFDALREATKGIFDDDGKWGLAWLKAAPYLTAGFLVGTPKWAAAVISLAISHAKQMYDEHVGARSGLKESMTSLGVSPDPGNIPTAFSTRRKKRSQASITRGQRRVRSKALPVDDRLVARYERCLTTAGVPYFYDHLKKSRSWDAPDQQELCLKITNPPLSRKWEERQEDGRTFYVNRITGDISNKRPGAAEIWAVKKKVNPEWVKSTTMTLPCGWEMRRTEEGEMFYLDHNQDPPLHTTYHPMRQEIEAERQNLLPEWNVEWDSDRGKKYRNIPTSEIRWKAVDGPRYVPFGDERARISLRDTQSGFVEPLPAGWIFTVEEDGRKIYYNGKTGKDKIKRTTHPLADKRRRLQPEWEMRYTPAGRRYWVHHARDGRGTSWWTRNSLLKNTSLKNDASGWKLNKEGQEWEWFEGGDVRHTEIPVLDLDDPAELEFREYPFILPRQLTDENGTFLEPLPPDWVRRTREDGEVYYWNFKDEIRSEQHPNEEERRDLPALWEMRFTRYGRQYFVDHDDGSTWWTHPREEKHEQKLRARPGQGQDGWKIAEDGKVWETFHDHPDAEDTEQTLDALSQSQSGEIRASADGSRPENWRSLSFTREWIKNISNSDVIANARTRVPKTPKMLRKYTKSPSIGSASTLAGSPLEALEDDDSAERKWLDDTPELVGTPELIDGSQLTEEPLSTNETGQPSSSLKEGTSAPSTISRSHSKLGDESVPQEGNITALSEEPECYSEPELKMKSTAGASIATTNTQLDDDSNLETLSRSPLLSPSPSPSPIPPSSKSPIAKRWTPIQNQIKKFKAPEKVSSFINTAQQLQEAGRLTPTKFLARKTKKGRSGENENEVVTLLDEEASVDNDVQAVMEGLGIMGVEGVGGAGGAKGLHPVAEKDDGDEGVGKVEGKEGGKGI